LEFCLKKIRGVDVLFSCRMSPTILDIFIGLIVNLLCVEVDVICALSDVVSLVTVDNSDNDDVRLEDKVEVT